MGPALILPAVVGGITAGAGGAVIGATATIATAAIIDSNSG